MKTIDSLCWFAVGWLVVGAIALTAVERRNDASVCNARFTTAQRLVTVVFWPAALLAASYSEDC